MMLNPMMYNTEYCEETDDRLILAVTTLFNSQSSAIAKKASRILLKLILKKECCDFLFKELETMTDVTDRNDPRVFRWKKVVLSKGHCESCGSTESLQAHHIAYWSESPMQRTDVKNGACLCARCHAEEHKGESIYRLMKSRLVVI